jgi:hypothetical protein
MQASKQPFCSSVFASSGVKSWLAEPVGVRQACALLDR